MAINVLLIGSGGREHALAWKIAQSPELGNFWAAPGNPGIEAFARSAPVDAGDHDALARFAAENDIGLVVVGPEGPLVAGLADTLRAAGIAVFGPSAGAARLEGSKGFTKDLCTLKDIPTAAYARFSELAAAEDYLREKGAPIVVKADGLASGKGVTVALALDDAIGAVRACFEGASAAGPGTEVVIEDFLEGPEASLFCLCDGADAVFFGTAEDHKRAFDGDRGPNTGGMGAFSPSVVLTPALIEDAMARIVRPTLAGLNEAGTPFAGVLYAGLILTKSGLQLIEYNVRFGDPECQTLMLRLESDLLPILLAVARGSLADIEPPRWRDAAATCVVLAAKGYPGTPARGGEIRLPAEESGTVIFQAGTKRDGDRLLADGGRVLGVSALGADIGEAAARAYAAVDRVEWADGFCRRDIARRAMVSNG